MKKRGITLSSILGIFLINLVSAQRFGNFGYGAFDSSLLVYGLFTIILFALISFALGRTRLGENKGTRTIISLAISILAVFWISKKNWGITTGNFYIGNTYIGDFFPSIIAIALTIGIIWAIVKWGFKNVLIFLGILMVLTSLTNLVYEKNLFLWVGIILIAIGIILKMRKPNWAGKSIEIPPGGRNTTREERRRQREIRRRARNIARIRNRRLRRDEERRQRRLSGGRKLLPPHTDNSEEQRRMAKIQEAMRRKKAKMERREQEKRKKMLRRGGETKRRSRFVSRKLVDRYAQRYGQEAAKKRFGI